ncbi:MAG: carboxypeptidase-like regulatory domain-containing protein [Lamprobacter sp.]|uniref:carboxypeptidase-like regulatory domain-containing protein n=1 Tax=Lamprobacter sp. TaxID=3100796 RepID=UPI002B25B787|nr:carboxypeptidase-like regulatory domain-containing protein [Lamprobacter sp.]MEA3640620.1 carboxypeptidase-like regulatory domain-containing protein [Lamprobacter sp.]
MAKMLSDLRAQCPDWRVRAWVAGRLPRQAPGLASSLGPIQVAGRLLVGLALLILSGPVQAHRLQVFASADGDQIQGRAYFVGGHPARGIEIQLLDADGQRVAELSSDDEGRFRAQVPAAEEYRVVAKSADGHRAEWPIAASELVGAFDAVTASAAPAAGVSSNGLSPDLIVAMPALAEPARQDDRLCFPAGTDLERALSAAIERGFEQGVGLQLEQRLEQSMARQLLPLREALAEAQGRASFRDLLGGLGYIAGLAGLGLWWTRRREQQRSVRDNIDD